MRWKIWKKINEGEKLINYENKRKIFDPVTI